MLIKPAKIWEDRSITYAIAGKQQVTEHFFKVPEDYHIASSPTITLFARFIERRKSDLTDASSQSTAPCMLYLQGGPGHGCSLLESFTEPLLDRGYQVLLLDQRGTGLSTPITAETLSAMDPALQHKKLKLYRADNIVRDCEAVRKALLSHKTAEHELKWSVTAQSFGGFCCVTYLSFYPEGLQEVFMYGGLQPLVTKPDEVYRRLYRKVAERNAAYYAKFLGDKQGVEDIIALIDNTKSILLPSGGALTVKRFRQLGLLFGMHGGLDIVHDIILRATNDIHNVGHLTRKSLKAIEDNTAFDEAILYSLLHEPIYCVGEAPEWSALRMQDDFPFRSNGYYTFTGEMIYPAMFEDYSELRKVAAVAELIARDADWPELFDKQQLSQNTVPVYATVYDDDMYVDADFAMETAKAIKGTKIYRTNVLLHNAVRAKTKETIDALFKLKEDVID